MDEEPEMVQRVGDALREQCKAEFGSTWSYDVAWRLARAAIEAMRTPTEAMLDGGREKMNWGPNGVDEVWQAMISAALSPSGEEI